jgi:hypothetical protein
MAKAYSVSYYNSAMFGKEIPGTKRRGFLEVEETVSESQLKRLQEFPFVKSLKILREFEV